MNAKLFLKLQIAFWLAFGLGAYLPDALLRGSSVDFPHMGPFIISGFLISLLMHLLYQNLQSLSFTQIVLVSIISSICCGQAWAFCFNFAFYALMDQDLRLIHWFSYFEGSLSNTFVLFSWSALYFSIKHHQDLQLQRRSTEQARHHALESQLKMLRYQLNPHFLFNSLNSIKALIQEDRGKQNQ